MIQVGDLVEPIFGHYNAGFTAVVLKIVDTDYCIVRFSSPKVKHKEQLRTIANLIKLKYQS